jgi:light-regulated signal transduction histidine kinase (bacteriophytochrome)
MTPTRTEGRDAALEACAREPIHVPGAIQPHGSLVSCSLPEWRIRHVANVERVFDMPPAELLGKPLSDFVEESVLEALAGAIRLAEPGQPAQTAAQANLGATGTRYQCTVHLSDGLAHVELEPCGAQDAHAPATLSQAMIAELVPARDEDDFFQRVADQVRSLTGYDRVMVYRFLHDDSGEVVAESRAGDIASYLGLRYPASDIPPQARALYLRNRIRIIPDAGYTPVPIVPGTLDGRPLDLSQHVLRSVSPVHLAYLANMGVAASMSISIVADGRLWGLIACHHRSPRLVPAHARAAADLFGLFVSMRVAARQMQRDAAYEDAARDARDMFDLRLANARLPALALATELGLARRALPCDGVALWSDGRWESAGRVPAGPGMERALAFVRRSGVLHHTDRAADWIGASDDGVAGLLAFPLPAVRDGWLLFFRCEEVEDVRWAGHPDDAFQVDASGHAIGPRDSFAVWRETRRGRSAPWTRVDLRLAERLRATLAARLQHGPGALSSVSDFAQQHHRLDVREHRERLLRLAELADGLGHLEPQQARELGEEIARLEARLRAALGAEASLDGS